MVEDKYLPDANTFITAYQTSYAFDIAPGYWKQLEPVLLRKNIFILDVVKAELEKGEDELTEWFRSIDELPVLDRKDSEIFANYVKVLRFLQESPMYTEKALREWSDEKVADPWLIAAARAKGVKIVTFEKGLGHITMPSGRPKIPDVAREFGVECIDLYTFMRKENIKWN